jgi:TrmH family RNA methyltransferase
MIFFTEDFYRRKDALLLFRRAAGKGVLLIQTSTQIIARLADTETPQGVVAVMARRSFSLDDMRFPGVALMVVCDAIQDPGNLGSLIRAADAAGADAVVILDGTCCDAFSPKTIRATAGSIFHIPIIRVSHEALRNYLSEKHISLYVADAHAGVSVFQADLTRPLAIAFGNEARGVSDTLRHYAEVSMSVPIYGRAESLNVAMAASVCLYEAARQRNK